MTPEQSLWIRTYIIYIEKGKIFPETYANSAVEEYRKAFPASANKGMKEIHNLNGRKVELERE